MSLRKIGLCVGRVGGVIAAVLGIGPCLQRQQHRVARVKLFAQSGKAQMLLCRIFNPVFLKIAQNRVRRGSGFLRCAEQCLILRQIEIRLIGRKPIHQHLHTGCAAGISAVLA